MDINLILSHRLTYLHTYCQIYPHLLDSPLLVRVHHELVLPADGVPHDPGPIRGDHGVT